MKKEQILLFCLLITGFCGSSFAAKVDTIATYSDVMQKTIPAIVITPDTYSSNKKYPVVYLLHGYSGDYTSWINIGGEYFRKTVDTEEIIIVSADGGFSSWYYDHPADKNWQYETYISSELIRWIDRHYSTIQSPKGRGITGLSMGGHGALFLAFKHPDVFAIAGSMSGGVDIRPFPLNWDLSKRLGSYAENPENWDKNTVINLTYLLTPNTLKLIIDCGTEDFFYLVNRNLHQKLLENNIPHDFISRPGKHDSAYWRNAVKYQLLFMVNHFKEFQLADK
jgi:S-formylglutathione hydrolase FrmB